MHDLRVALYYIALAFAIIWIFVDRDAVGFSDFEKIVVLLLLAIAMKEDRDD